MITVAGEALIDLIIDPAGHVDPRLGGGPFNVTRAVARLDQPVAFLGRLSGDRFGRLMRADLDRPGVLVAIQAPTDAPTTLALVDVDPAGVPGYHFYLAGTSAAAVGPGEAALPADTTALHVGSLGLVMEPVGTSMEQLVAELPGGVTVMLDPNCRPGAIASRQALPGPAQPRAAPGGRGQDQHRGPRLPRCRTPAGGCPPNWWSSSRPLPRGRPAAFLLSAHGRLTHMPK